MRNVWVGVLALVWVLGAAILFWPAQSKDPLSLEAYVEELGPDSVRVTGPVLFTLCDIPVMMIEPDGDGFIHYEGESMNERLQELEFEPIITNEISEGLAMECRRINGPTPHDEPTPYRREPVPDIKDHIREWSA